MAATLVPVEEYLATDYSPDVDYVDGVLEDRNVGEVDHADLQGRLYSYLFARRREFGIYPLIETRMQISGNRYRVPDVCAVIGERPSERILTRPPLLCIEVLSPEDRMVRVQEKIADFLRSGVRFVLGGQSGNVVRDHLYCIRHLPGHGRGTSHRRARYRRSARRAIVSPQGGTPCL